MSSTSSTSSVASSDYHLTYFNFRGSAEVIRLLFAISKVAFEDERIPFTVTNGAVCRPEWDAKKNDRLQFPFQRIPVLRLADGSTIAQSRSIERFLSKRFGLLGKTELDVAHIDSLVEQLNDARKAYIDAKTKQMAGDGVAMQDYLSKELPRYGMLYEEWLERSLAKGCTTPFFVGNEISHADVAIYYFLWSLENSTEQEKKAVTDLLKTTPKLSAVKDAVANLPQVQEYVAKRPHAVF